MKSRRSTDILTISVGETLLDYCIEICRATPGEWKHDRLHFLSNLVARTWNKPILNVRTSTRSTIPVIAAAVADLNFPYALVPALSLPCSCNHVIACPS